MGWEHLTCQERLGGLGLLSLEKGKPRGILSMCINPWWWMNSKDGVQYFSVVPSERTRGKGRNLKYREFNLNIKKPPTVGGKNPGNRLP